MIQGLRYFWGEIAGEYGHGFDDGIGDKWENENPSVRKWYEGCTFLAEICMGGLICLRRPGRRISVDR
jgi:hypothetical protein